jgi:DNA-binding transcriptional regulator YhcF (GntR family)
MPTVTKSGNRASKLLRKLIARARSSGDLRLPTVQKLAKMACVAPRTMWKAVATMREHGVLLARPRSGIRVTGRLGEDERPADRRAGPKWERLYAQLKSDIVTGRYKAAAPLPAPKALCVSYGVVHPTMKKALDRLVQDHAITPSRRSYKIVTVLSPARRNTIVLVGQGDSFGDLDMSLGRNSERLRLLESECARAGIRLLTRTGYWTGPSMAGLDNIERLIGDPASRSAILGFMVWSTSLPDKFMKDLLGLMSTTRKPVAVLDERGDVSFGGMIGKNPRARVFEVALGAEPGRQTARYLLSLGHRKLAYIHPEPMPRWAHNRLIGMKEEFGSVATPTEIRLFPVDTSAAERLEFMDDPELRVIVDTIQRRRSGAKKLSQPIPVRTTNEIIGRIYDSVYRLVLRESALPVLEEVLSQADATAWIGANDHVAAVCVDFLRSKGLSIPAQYSVVGFDDTYEASLLKLTSYNFNSAACVNAMLGHILRAGLDKGRKSTGGQNVEIKGFITVRASTGEARKTK